MLLEPLIIMDVVGLVSEFVLQPVLVNVHMNAQELNQQILVHQAIIARLVHRQILVVLAAMGHVQEAVKMFAILAVIKDARMAVAMVAVLEVVLMRAVLLVLEDAIVQEI